MVWLLLFANYITTFGGIPCLLRLQAPVKMRLPGSGTRFDTTGAYFNGSFSGRGYAKKKETADGRV